MVLVRWKQISKKTLFKNPFWTYYLDEFEIPEKMIGEYHYISTGGSSMVIPIDDRGKIGLVKQYRYLCDRDSIEFPCGSIKPGSDYISTAKAELSEEAGVAAKNFHLIGSFNPYNGVTTEICNVYIATGLIPQETKSDDTEDFERLWISREVFEKLILSGEIWDGMTLAAWMLAHPQLGQYQKV